MRDDLAQEGASDEMLSKSIFRLREFVDVVDFYTEKAWGEIVLNKHPNRIVMKFSLLVTQPQGMVLRLLKKAYAEIHAGQDGYGPRRDKLERIVGELCHAPEHFERQTLGGCILTLNEKDDTFTLELEG